MKVEFIKSIYNIADYKPTSLPEFAFGGRSNAGKSSLINAVFQCKIAHTSKKPGKTKCINLFKVENQYIIADLPGYGYASVSNKMQDDWKILIEEYFSKSKILKKAFILADVKRGLQEEEYIFMDWLNHLQKAYRIVFTKIDKIGTNELIQSKNTFSYLTPIYFSAITKEGRKDILSEISKLL